VSDRFIVAEHVYTYRCLVTMGYCGNNILGTKCSVATKKHLAETGLKGDFVNHRHIPLAKYQANITLYPGKGVFLAQGHQYNICFHEHPVFPCRYQTAPTILIVFRGYFFK